MTSVTPTIEPPAHAAVRRGRPGNPGASRDGRLAMWLLAPAVVLLVIVVGCPILWALLRSLFDDPIREAPRFIGLENYSRALSSSDFWEALRVTLFFAIVTVGLEVAIGFAMALIMDGVAHGRSLVRTSVLVPWAIPTAVSAVLWSWMLQPTGILNQLLGTEVIWTGREWPAKLAIIVADTWKTAPFVGLILLAGLQTIPRQLYEAARIDGASQWQQFRSITLPLVRPALLVAVLFRALDVLRIYDLPAILTGGANDTTTLSILVVQAAIGTLRPGYGSALSTLTFLVVFLVAFVFVYLFGARVVQREAGGRN